MDPTKSPGIRFDQIFLNSAHFTHREDALNLPPDTPHPANMRIDVRIQFYRHTEPGKAGVGITVSTDPEDQSILYQFELEMVVLASEISTQENMSVLDYIKGPALVAAVPFLREAVASLTIRGRFGPVWLQPMNLQHVLVESGSRAELEVPAAQENPRKERVTA